MYRQGQKHVKEALNATREREVDPHQAEPESAVEYLPNIGHA